MIEVRDVVRPEKVHLKWFLFYLMERQRMGIATPGGWQNQQQQKRSCPKIFPLSPFVCFGVTRGFAQVLMSQRQLLP